MQHRWYAQRPSRELVLAVVLAAVVLFGLIGITRLERERRASAVDPPLSVPLFLDPGRVAHDSRLTFTFDPPEVLAPLRRQEGLDDVVAGATSDEEAYRRLTGWVREQWEPGRPDPYPPPDARVILRDIRDSFTGGFCAQYCFVLVQAVQSFGLPARMVTVTGHEVVEAWLRDQRRWVMLDPTYELQVMDGAGRTLSALEIHRAAAAGEPVAFTDGNRADESPEAYARRFLRFAVWIRDDFVSRPMNFTDFDRYRVWFAPGGGEGLPAESLRTPFAEDLYPEPTWLGSR